VLCSQVIDTILFDVNDTRGVVGGQRIAAVFVDEIRKATNVMSDMAPCVAVYTAVVGVVASGRARLLFTALDQVSAFGIMDDGKPASASGTPITWLSLPPVVVDVGQSDRLLERCVALAHGHPRSTSHVLRVRRENKADDAQSLFERLEEAIAGKAVAPVAPFLAPALMCIRLQMDDTFDNSELSFGATIRGGALLNSCTRDGEDATLDFAVPLLDLFSLRLAADKLDGTLRDSVVKMCEMLHKVVSGEEYEVLHAHWETTLRCLFYKHRMHLKCDASMPLLSESTDSSDFPLALYRGVTFLSSSGSDVMIRTTSCKPVLRLKEKLSDTLTECHDEHGKAVRQIEVGQTVVAGARNAGFDLATLFEEAGTKKKHLLLIECKQSPAETGSVQGWLDVDDTPVRAGPARVADDNDNDDDDLAHDPRGKGKMQGEKKTKMVKKRVRKVRSGIDNEKAPPQAATAKKGPDGLSKKMQVMSETVTRVLKSAQHLFVRSGITDASQITYLFVLLRPITDAFIGESIEWIAKNNIKFNVAVIARDALLALYGSSLEGAVAFVVKAEDE
jgi:hypothetical protein